VDSEQRSLLNVKSTPLRTLVTLGVVGASLQLQFQFLVMSQSIGAAMAELREKHAREVEDFVAGVISGSFSDLMERQDAEILALIARYRDMMEDDDPVPELVTAPVTPLLTIEERYNNAREEMMTRWEIERVILIGDRELSEMEVLELEDEHNRELLELMERFQQLNPEPVKYEQYTIQEITCLTEEYSMAHDVSDLVNNRDCHYNCERCGAEMFTYLNGQFLCEPCARNDNDDVVGIDTLDLFGGRVYRQNEGYLFATNNIRDYRTYFADTWTLIDSILSHYYCLPNEYREVRGESRLVWENPLANGETTPYINAIRQLNDIFNHNGNVTEAAPLIRLLMVDSAQMAVQTARRLCGCDPINSLVMHFCDLCAYRVASQLLTTSNIDGIRHLHQQIQDDLFSESQLILPGEEWDEENMRQGNDDHGDFVENGEVYQWIQAGIQECGVCGDTVDCRNCHNGHSFCVECVAAWSTIGSGRCPVCRVRMSD